MSTRQIVYAALLAALYAVIGRFLTQYLPNPMVRGGSIIAINMVVVVIAGILLGPRMGALVGFVGTLLNAIIVPQAAKVSGVAPCSRTRSWGTWRACWVGLIRSWPRSPSSWATG